MDGWTTTDPTVHQTFGVVGLKPTDGFVFPGLYRSRLGLNILNVFTAVVSACPPWTGLVIRYREQLGAHVGFPGKYLVRHVPPTLKETRHPWPQTVAHVTASENWDGNLSVNTHEPEPRWHKHVQVFGLSVVLESLRWRWVDVNMNQTTLGGLYQTPPPTSHRKHTTDASWTNKRLMSTSTWSIRCINAPVKGHSVSKTHGVS